MPPKDEWEMGLDSTNIGPRHWQQIARFIYKKLPGTDGVVISHGTDTMAYTAAALYTMLPGLDKPVILTGSQIPIEEAGTDAVRNLEDAFRVCASGIFPGVYIVFAGEIIAGFCGNKSHSTSLQAFSSINYPTAGIIRDGIIRKNESFPPATSNHPLQLKEKLNPNIALLKLIPGMDGKIVDILRAQGYEGILIEAFGVGGIPNLDDSFASAISRCISSQIPVAATTQCGQGPADLSIYQVGSKAQEAGAICGKYLSREMLTVRLMWALGQAEDYSQIRRLLFQGVPPAPKP